MNTQALLDPKWTPRQRESFLEELFLTNSFADLQVAVQGFLERQLSCQVTLLLHHPVGRLTLFESQTGPTMERRLVLEGLPDWQNHIWLADSLKRPVGAHLLFPVSDREDSEKVYLLLEGREIPTQESLAHLQAVLKAVSDSLLVRRRLDDASEQWASTFDFMPDPVLVVREDHTLLRSNRGGQDSLVKCYEVFGEIKPCDDCPLGRGERGQISTPRGQFLVHSSRLLMSEDSDLYIHHYQDRTKERQLYSQLVQSQKMAAVGLLAGSIAHELSNPLTGIKALVESILLELPNNQPIASDFREIREAAIRSQEIIQNLLAFAFPGQERPEETFDPLEVINKTLPLLKVQLRGVHVLLPVLEGRLLVKGSRSGFQQVIFNLIQNASQVMKSQGTISVEVEPDVEFVKIKVSDTGGGVPDSHQDRIFEPFFTTKESGEGTGLGLSVSSQMMTDMGGALKFLGNNTAGAVFEITMRRSPT